MANYLMRRHVYACRTTDHIVMLDLRRDRYLALAGPHTEHLASLVEGWPSASGQVTCPVPDADRGARVLHQLTAQGLLTADPAYGKSAEPIDFPAATSTLVGEYADVESPIRVRRVASFCLSVARAACQLRWLSLHSAVKSVEDRRAQCATISDAPSVDIARSAVATFTRLRPLAFTAHDGCLFDSLALIHFLASEGLYPHWVIGVKTGPFGAHSWVQKGGLVYNDLPERVRKFTPILVA